MKTVNEFYANIRNAILVTAPKSMLLQPKINFSGGSIKWRDDSIDKRQESFLTANVYYNGQKIGNEVISDRSMTDAEVIARALSLDSLMATSDDDKAILEDMRGKKVPYVYADDYRNYCIDWENMQVVWN